MRKNCSTDREKLLKFEAEGQEFSKFLRSIEQFTYSNSERSEQFLATECFFKTCSWRFFRSQKIEQCIQTVKGQYNFWQQNAFLTWSWRFLRSNKLEQLEFKVEKIIGI